MWEVETSSIAIEVSILLQQSLSSHVLKLHFIPCDLTFNLWGLELELCIMEVWINGLLIPFYKRDELPLKVLLHILTNSYSRELDFELRTWACNSNSLAFVIFDPEGVYLSAQLLQKWTLNICKSLRYCFRCVQTSRGEYWHENLSRMEIIVYYSSLLFERIVLSEGFFRLLSVVNVWSSFESLAFLPQNRMGAIA